jgi:hypothetical protein
MTKEAALEEKGTRLYAGLTGVISSILFCGVYVFLRTVPFLNIYLDADRRRYLLMVYVLSVIGVFIFLAARDKVKGWPLKLPLYIFSFVFLIGIPVVFCISSGTSQKGWEWAFTTFLIGLVPVVLVILAFLILYGYHFFSLVLFGFFSMVSVYHIILAVQRFNDLGKGFTGVWLKDVLLAVVIIGLSAFFAFLNFRHFRSS